MFVITKKQVAQSTAYWLGETEWKHFITLTFNEDVTDGRAQKELRIFLKRLNNALYGRRSRRQIKTAPFLEHTKANRPHFHLLLGSNDSNKVYDLQKLVLGIWDMTSVTSTYHLLDNEEWFKHVKHESKSDLIRYCLKQCGRDIDSLELEFLVI